LEEEVMKKFNSKTAIQCLAFVCALIILSQVSIAGSLNPSAAPAPTMKTLDQVEPRTPIPGSAISVSAFTISQSGSYYLTGNRLCDANGIIVEANNVTIDLCGFSLIGNNAGSGIYMMDRTNVEISNGTIRNFNYGINDNYIFMITNGYSINHRVIGIRALSNAKFGIRLYGPNCEVRDCISSNNGTSASGTSIFGISVGNNCKVTGNTVSDNGASAQFNAWVFGITAGTNCTITGNKVQNNGITNAGLNTIYAIATAAGSTITANTVSGNGYSAGTVYGIYANIGSTVTGNTIYGNGNTATAQVNGIYAASGCTVTGNTAYMNGLSATVGPVYVLYAGPGCSVIGNTVYSNGQSASGVNYGIYLVGNNLVDQNTSYSNNGTNMNNPGTCSFGKNIPQLP
jgi:hypothetical protein